MTNSYAFFDVDGTLLRLKSMFSFHDFWYQRWIGLDSDARVEEYEDVTAIMRALVESGEQRELINRRYYEFFSGRSVEEVERCAQAWARTVVADPRIFVTDVIDELEALRAKGVEPVFVSGSFIEVLSPIADHLGVSHMLATRLLHDGKTYTGRFRAPQTIGEGKALAISEFLAERSTLPTDCWAFGDDISDVPMLEAVGRPVAVIGDSALSSTARARGWKCLHICASDDPLMIREGLGALVGEAT
ncbi:HAD family hydrolase [Roseateles sp. BYS180W]|uniref:HAD family hydrolase n=1 Tax=Roseateles rivi TaxID=3299028 RepID=A0ABW7FVJ2_9BURK